MLKSLGFKSRDDRFAGSAAAARRNRSSNGAVRRLKKSGFSSSFEQQFGEQQQLVVETDVADVVAARGVAGEARGLVGDVATRSHAEVKAGRRA